MKICPDHWEKLRAAIKDRGLDHLGAKSGPELAEIITDELEGRDAEFDPLFACNNMIWGRGLEMGGIYLMGQKDDGSDYCPICEAIAHKPDDTEAQWVEDFWILGPADACLIRARELGLVPPQQ